MVNIIEIRVQTVFDPTGLDEGKAEATSAAQAIAAVFEESGSEAGDGFTSAFTGALSGRLGESAAPAGEEVSAVLAESVAGTGDAMASEIGDGLASGLAGAGEKSAAQLGEHLVEAVSGSGQQAAAAFGDEFAAGAGEAGAAAGDALAEGLESGSQGVTMLGSQISTMLRDGIAAGLPQIDAEVQQVMQQLPAVVEPEAVYAGLHIGATLGASLAAAGAAASAGIGPALVGPLTATAVDAATEAGQAAGDALIAGIGDTASGTAGKAAAKIAASISAPLDTAMTETGQSAGDALVAGVGDAGSEVGRDVQEGAVSSLAEAGVSGAEAFAKPLETQLPAVAARIGADTGAVLTQELAQGGAQGGDALGAQVLTATADIGEQAAAQIRGQLAQADLGSGVEQALFAVPEIAAEEGTAAGATFGQSLTGAASRTLGYLPDLAAAAWAQARAEVSGPAQGALFDVSEVAGQQGASAGARFAGAFLGGLDQIAEMFQGPMAESGTAAGSTFGQFFVGGVSRAMELLRGPAYMTGAEIAAELADGVQEGLFDISEVAGAQGVSAGTAFGQFFSGAAAAVLGVFARDPAKQVGEEIGDSLAGGVQGSLFELVDVGGMAVAMLNDTLVAGMQETGVSAGAALATGLREGQGAIEGSAAQIEATLDLFYRSIVETGATVSPQLGAAMLGALQGIEQDTSAFTARETAQWTEFFTMLETEGNQAAYELSVSMGSLQGKELGELGLGSSGVAFKNVAGDAQDAEESVAGVGKAAAGAASEFGGLGAMMMGPVGMGAMGLMMVLPMLSGAFSSAEVSASAFTASITQDSGAVGDNTAAVIQSTLAKSGLNDISQALGVSQATLIEYAAGEKQAQDQVTAAYNAQQGSLQAASTAEGVHSKAQNDSGNSADKESNALASKKAALDQATAAVQQAIQQDADQSAALLAAEQSTQIYNASVNALGESMLVQAQQTKMSDQATVDFGPKLIAAASSASYMSAAVGAAGVNLKLQAISTNVAAEALNNSLAPQAQLSQEAMTAAQAYTQAQQATSAYTTSLTALYGQFGTTTGAEATFTTDLAGLSGTLTHGKDAVDQYTAAGAKNLTALEQLASQAITTAGDIYQTTGSTDKANTALRTMATELDTAASKAGFTKGQIAQLNTELFGVPTVKQITISANTAPASWAVSSLLNQIDSDNASFNVTAKMASLAGHAAGGITGMSYAAAGGSQYGGATVIDEQGTEMVNLPNGSQVMPAANTASMLAGGFGAPPLRIELEWVGGQSDGQFMSWLRQNVRIRGGSGSDSVQRALGQVS